MGLDYVNECANFRDFGGYINLILGKKYLPERKLFRGGSIDYVKDPGDIENEKSVICFRYMTLFNFRIQLINCCTNIIHNPRESNFKFIL